MYSPLYLDETHKNNIQFLNLTSCSAVQSLECKVHNLIALLILNIQTQYCSHTDSMSVNA